MRKSKPSNEATFSFDKAIKWVARYKRTFLLIALLVGTLLLLRYGMVNMKNSYETTKENVRDGFYQTAFDYAESQNHVTNRAVINISLTRTDPLLEVLKVYDTAFVIKSADDSQKITSWLEVQGSGTFTVNLAAGEYIVDPQRKYVLVKVPVPILTDFALEDTGHQFFVQGTLFNGSIGQGVQLSMSQLSEGRLKIEESIRQNPEFFDAAQKSAKQIIESLVQQWNPNIPGLHVDVDFIYS